jgi:MATE family multidrug resistance protein
MTRSESTGSRWWREMRITAALAAPIIGGQLAQMAMNMVDTWLAGRHGTLTQAAVAAGSAVWTVAILACVGILMAIPPTVSQLDGAKRRDEIGEVFRQALWLALAIGLALGAFMQASPWLLGSFGVDAAVIPPTADFLSKAGLGAPALALFFCCRYLCEGVAWTTPTLLIGLLGPLLLLPLGAWLMAGQGPLPVEGAGGLGAALAIVLWIQALAFLACIGLARRVAGLRLLARGSWPRWTPIRALLALGLPMGFSIFMEGGLFVITALLIGRLGDAALAAHQIAILIASACFMVPLGIAMAMTVRIGNAVGAGDPVAMRWAAYGGYGLGLASQTLGALMLWFGAGWLAALFSRDPAVVSLAAGLMLYAAVFQYPDGLQAMSAGALRGLKDTLVPAAITGFAYWGVGLPVGVWLGFVAGQGVAGLWTGLIAGLVCAAGLLTWRYWRLLGRRERLAAA